MALESPLLSDGCFVETKLTVTINTFEVSMGRDLLTNYLRVLIIVKDQHFVNYSSLHRIRSNFALAFNDVSKHGNNPQTA